MTEASCTTIIKAPANAVWETISDFNGLPNYVALVIESKMEGEGVGALRKFTLADGGYLVERLESIDPEAHTLSYSILESPLPFENYLATMELTALGENQCQLKWYSQFDPKGDATAEEAIGVAEGVYNLGFDGLKELHESS